MDAAAKSAALWGAVAAVAFLALYQGYVLLGNDGVGVLAAIAVAVVVAGFTGVAAYLTEARLAARGR